MRLLCVLFLMIFCGCSQDEDIALVAEYNEDVLTIYDVEKFVPNDSSPDDSLKIAQSYIKKWSLDKVFQSEAEEILPDETLNTIKVQVLDYREMLIANYLEEFWLNDSINSVDSLVVNAYYTDNKDGFTTNEDLVKFQFIKVPNDSASVFRNLFYSAKKEDYKRLKNKLEANDYTNEIAPNKWVGFNNLKKSLPLPKISNNKRFLQTSKRLSFTEGNDTYFIKFTDYALRGETAPFVYVYPSVKKIVSNQMKIQRLAKKKKELYEKALQNKALKLY